MIVQRHCHKLVMATAIEMAGEVYELVMVDNDKWAYWKSMCPDLTREAARDNFVELLWPKLIEEARATLAKMLAAPIHENLKATIYEALLLDAALQRGRPRRERRAIAAETRH